MKKRLLTLLFTFICSIIFSQESPLSREDFVLYFEGSDSLVKLSEPAPKALISQGETLTRERLTAQLSNSMLTMALWRSFEFEQEAKMTEEAGLISGFDRDSHVVFLLATERASYRTPRGITVGSTLNDVRNSYGFDEYFPQETPRTPFSGEGHLIYGIRDDQSALPASVLSLAFYFENSVIRKIFIFSGLPYGI